MENLLAQYRQRLKLQNAVFSRIDHNEAMVAIVYKITQPDGTQLILKICSRPADYFHEEFFLTRFAGQLPVPRIVQLVPPENLIHGAILMECLAGELLSKAEFTEALAYEVGSLLARIHLNRTPGYGDLIQSQDLSPDPRVHFSLKFEESMQECSNHLPKKLLQQCRHYFDEHLSLLDSADAPCIVHRDYRPGNLIVDHGKVQGIIDWSSARSSFAQEDFCSWEHGEWPNRPASHQSFLAGYAHIRPIPDYHAMMPLLRLSKAIATIGFTVKRETWNSTHTKLYQYNRHCSAGLSRGICVGSTATPSYRLDPCSRGRTLSHSARHRLEKNPSAQSVSRSAPPRAI